jgi:hypothetical protein
LDAESNFSPIGNQNLIEHIGSELGKGKWANAKIQHYAMMKSG